MVPVDVPPDTGPGARGPRGAPGGVRPWAHRVAALPDRLLLALLATCLVVAVAVVLGQHRPVVVGPAALVAVGLVWSRRAATAPWGRSDAVAGVACLALLVAWVVAQLPLTGERLLVARDPDVYTLTALWLVDHPALAVPVPPGGDGTLGFDLAGGAWRPQGNHLVPALSAVLGWAGGERAVLASGLAWGAAALLALFATARRVVGSWWALLPVVALGGSLPLLDTSRSLYTEPLAMALVLLGAGLLLDAWRSGRLGDVALAGIALGVVCLARIDGLAVVVGVAAGLSPLAVASPGARPALRFGSVLVTGAAAPLVVLSVLDLRWHTGIYFDNMRAQVAALVAGAGIAAVAATALAVLPDSRLRWWRWLVPRAAPVAAVLLVGLVALLATRPWWDTGRGASGNPVVATVQAAQGLPADPTRTYTELTLTWLTWYWGVAAVALGFLGWALWLLLGLRRPARRELVVLLLAALPSALLYLWAPAITPDQVWAARRFLPVVVPLLLVGAVWALRLLASSRRGGRGPVVVAAALAAVVVAEPVTTLPALWSVRDRHGVRAGVERVCDRIGERPAVVTGVDTLAPSIRVVCGVPVLAVVEREPSAARLAAAREALGGGDVAVVTRDPDGLEWQDDPAPPVEIRSTQWEATLTRRPQQASTSGTLVTVGSVDASGRASR